MIPVARARVMERAGEDVYEGVAVHLDSHHKSVSRVAEAVFASPDLVRVVAERHDKYKPIAMRLEDADGSLRVGFRGHPYMLSFRDFEDVFDYPRSVAIATCIGRLHHFINLRNVDTFVHTMALAKSYLDARGVFVGLGELKKEVLKGVLMLHVADMVAGFVEQALLSRSTEPAVYDTESLEDIEPHLPLSVSVNVESEPVIAVVRFHGLTEALNPAILSARELRVDLEYTLCKGILRHGGRIFEESLCDRVPVSLVFVHKRVLVKELVNR